MGTTSPSRPGPPGGRCHSRPPGGCSPPTNGLLYATRLFAQCVAEDHRAGLLFAKRFFARCVAEDQRLAERRAQAQERAAAHTIFLWLRRRRLHIQLARQTSRRQQREAALAHLRYKQDCCSRAALAKEQHRQAAAAREKALADKADRRRRQDVLAKEQHRHEAARALQEAAAACAHLEAAQVSTTIACARQEDARHQQLLAEQAARARQEAAAACARQDAARVSDAIARARQDNDYDDDNKNDNNDDDDDDDEDYDDDDDDNDDAEDEYNDVAGRLKAYAATLFACVDATMAKIQAMDDGFENRAAAQEKVLANEANERQRAAAREKALAYKLRRAAAQEKALANEAKERREVVAHTKALAAKVLADKQGGQELAVRAKVFAAQALAIATSLPPPPHIVCGCGSVYSGGEPSAGCAVVSTIAYHRQSAANGRPTQLTLLPCWPPPWPPGSQSTGAPSLRAAPSAPGSQLIYCE
jgi:hypothetical protein